MFIIVNIFSVLGDNNRLRVVLLLMNRELCMSHIQLGLDLKQANTSKILKNLKDYDIVSLRVKKKNRYYKLNDEFVKKYNDIFRYLEKLSEEQSFIVDKNRLYSVEKCGCIGLCECKL